MAITGGSTCYCGNMLPAADLVVDDSKCDSKCNGYDQETCGGIGYWQVYLDGLSGNVEVAPNSTISSVSAGPSSTTASATRAPETVVVTASSSAKPSSKSSGVAGDGNDGPNKIGIAVGVVVGVLVLAAITGGAIFFVKQRRRKHIEEEHKAQAINSFPGSRSSDTKSDARLDPSVASSYRRESIGSIADERDFSRRILQVRNPDNRGSLQSVA
ncbi:Protein SLG1 [Exophiala xenobiotica]|uniref:Protein SLG1 n=1 Tax=Lithohypha guttulata TaxID=1690604 RepID=A0ABR0KBT3_9EURO|nr:Protein SLG1 [Lithohypha guttulata]KAK5326875.1 Protein SLG1 [Exophiala xenobiotica]